MLTVVIYINGAPVFSRSAARVSPDKPNEYTVDTKETIIHTPEEGAVSLAHKLLNTIKEPVAETTSKDD